MKNEKRNSKKKTPTWLVVIFFLVGVYFIVKECLTSYDLLSASSVLMIGAGVLFFIGGGAAILQNNKIDKEGNE